VKPKRITTLGDLVSAAERRRAIHSFAWPVTRTPAAFIVHLPAIQVHRMIERGMWIYEPKKARKP